MIEMGQNLRLIRKILALALIMTTFMSYPMKAVTYKPIIREDRVWECSILFGGEDCIKCLKFGEQKEFLGNTYTEIVAFKKTLYHYSNGNFTYEFLDNVSSPEGFMREDDGVVYTLVVSVEDSNACFLFKSDYELKDSDILAEVPIYNFNVEPDEHVDLFTFSLDCGYCQTFKVISKSTISIEDEDCTKVEIRPVFIDYDGEEYLGNEQFFIEGIGAEDYGCLNYTEFGVLRADCRFINYLTRVFDIDGSVIFGSPDFFPGLEYGDFSRVEKVEENYGLSIHDGLITFDSTARQNSVFIYDMNGRLLKAASARGKVEVSTADLHPGIYIAVPSSDGVTGSPRKFVVK